MSDVQNSRHILEPDENQLCRICRSADHIKTYPVKISGSVFFVYAHLCLDCRNKGWITIWEASPNGEITYYNPKTNEFRHLK